MKYYQLLLLFIGHNLLISQADAHKILSTLEIYELSTGNRDTVYSTKEHFEAPNWAPNEDYLIFNSKGKLLKIPLKTRKPKIIPTQFATNCNNDHGISPNGKQIVISHHESSTKLSKIYILPKNGGTPMLITDKGPSYWHGWSPDGENLAYCAERNNNYDIYTMNINYKTETKLTSTEGLDDGPEYSHDGRYIYFNSVRSGLMKIWRIDIDGKNQLQITNDDIYNDWFPHPSPDGKHLLFLSYKKEDVLPGDHPANKNVEIRLLNIETGKTQTLVNIFGGQGSLNVPSWSPDSKKFAFVSYKLLD